MIYTKQFTGPVDIDDYSAILETWDVSAHLTPFQTNPLTLSYFDAIVICFDIKDEANLKSVVDKVRCETARHERMVTTRDTDLLGIVAPRSQCVHS